MTNINDINKHGGWLARVTTSGDPPLMRHYFVYELDKDRALALVSPRVSEGETVELLRGLKVHELTGYEMKPGDVKLY